MVLTFLHGKGNTAKIKTAQDIGLQNWVKHHRIKNAELQFNKTHQNQTAAGQGGQGSWC